jgi:hypothetical protein
MDKVVYPSSVEECFGGLPDGQRLGAPVSVRPGEVCNDQTCQWRRPMAPLSGLEAQFRRAMATSPDSTDKFATTALPNYTSDNEEVDCPCHRVTLPP